MRMIAKRRSIGSLMLLAGIALLGMQPGIEATPPGARFQDTLAETPASTAELNLPAALSPTEAKGPWVGPDGEVLAFRTGDEVAAFLRSARIVSMSDIPVGVTSPRKLLLERGGVRTHAIFRYEHIVKDQMRLRNGTFHMYFRDSYLGEPAAYELARLLGLNTVPPATTRSLPRLGRGSIQLWIEGAMTEADRIERRIQAPDAVRFARQLQNMSVFDNLVHNIDRNLGNILIGPDWKIWYIDCTRCFARSQELPSPHRVRSIERRFWERLQAVDWSEARARLDPYLSSFEFRALQIRHGKVVERIQQRIDEIGERAVLFSFEEDGGHDVRDIPVFPADTPEIEPDPESRPSGS
jgi:hypothetical protein